MGRTEGKREEDRGNARKRARKVVERTEKGKRRGREEKGEWGGRRKEGRKGGRNEVEGEIKKFGSKYLCMMTPSNGFTHLLKCSRKEDVNGRFEQLG